MRLSSLMPFAIVALVLGNIVYLGIKKRATGRLNKRNPPPQNWDKHNPSTVVTLKPSYPRAFLKTFVWVFILITLFSGVAPYFQGKVVSLEHILSPAIIGGLFFSFLVTVLFTPREITWSEESIKIRALFPGSGDFDWEQLETWSPYGRGTFLIKFEGKQAFQISPSGFRKKDWKAFRSFLDLHFSNKKTLFWVGVTPIRFDKK